MFGWYLLRFGRSAMRCEITKRGGKEEREDMVSETRRENGKEGRFLNRRRGNELLKTEDMHVPGPH